MSLTRLHLFFILSIAASLTACGEVSDYSTPTLTYVPSNDVDTAYVTFKAFDICQSSIHKDLCNLNLSVHTSLKYGEGPDDVLSPDELIKYGYGNCGHYSDLLTTELINLGVSSERISVFSSKGAIHTFVEVKTSSGNFVMDPTLGLFYKNDFITMLNNPYKSYEYVGVLQPLIWVYASIYLYDSIEFFLFNDATTYQFSDVDMSAKQTVSSTRLMVNSNGMDFLTLHFDIPLNFYLTHDYKVSFVFQPRHGNLGVYMPTYGRASLTIQFNQSIGPLIDSGSVQLVGKQLQ